MWAARALLTSRALGWLAPAGVEMPLPYWAAATRISCSSVLPQSGWARLLPVPSIDRTAPASGWHRSSIGSTLGRNLTLGARAARAGVRGGDAHRRNQAGNMGRLRGSDEGARPRE